VARRKSPPKGIKTQAKKLVCIVEGHGEVAAIPCLCSKILVQLEAWTWHVDPTPFRQPKSQLIREAGLERAIDLAVRSREADAVLVVCDADDDCPAQWSETAATVFATRGNGGAVMAMREYESWLLSSVVRQARSGNRAIEQIRDAKGHLEQYVKGYLPTLHQLQLTRSLEIDTVWSLSDSFDKLIRTLGAICGVPPGTRPLALRLH
jgi:hypothetical protein